MGGRLPSGGADDDADAPADADDVGAVSAPAVTSKWPSRIGLSAGALVAVGAVVATMIAVSGPRPDATLAQIPGPAPLDVLVVVNTEPYFRIDGSTLRAYESFGGWDIWSGSNRYGSQCLVAIAPTDDWIRVECTPEPAQLVADTFPYSQPDGPMIRFVLVGDAVQAWVYPHAEAP